MIGVLLGWGIAFAAWALLFAFARGIDKRRNQLDDLERRVDALERRRSRPTA